MTDRRRPGGALRSRRRLARRGFTVEPGAGGPALACTDRGGPPEVAAQSVVEELVPGGTAVQTDLRTALPWAPSRPLALRGRRLSLDGRRVVVALTDIDGHDGQLRLLPQGADEVVTIPLRRGDAVVCGPDAEIGAHPNHTGSPTSWLEILVEPAGAVTGAALLPRRVVDAAGYECVDLLAPDQVSSLRRVVDSLVLAPDHGFFASPKDVNGQQARDADLAMRAVVSDSVRSEFPGYVPFMIAVTSKGRSGDPVDFHQDWTYVDERQERTLFLWCPLVDAGPRNGGLSVVPGSHLWCDSIRPSRVLPLPVVTEPHQAAFRSMSTSLTVPAGGAVLFDPATVHGSGPNPTGDPRPAITIALAPADAALVHFHEDPYGSLTGFEVDDAFFTMSPFRAEPVGHPPLRPWTHALSVEELGEAVARQVSAAEVSG